MRNTGEGDRGTPVVSDLEVSGVRTVTKKCLCSLVLVLVGR